MHLRVLIVPDKFKGSLTAFQAADAIAEGWLRARPGDHVDLLPMSDGGDGFGNVLSSHLHAQPQTIQTVDAAGRPLQAGWWWDPNHRLAIIESAQVIGLALLPPGKYHPFDLDTRGLGAAIHAAREKGAVRCLTGIGGSATNDAGFGVASALGWRFIDARGNPIESWTQLDGLASIRPPRRRHWFKEFRVAVDVQNRLLGKYGASRVYGPQKGLRPEDFPVADRCFRRLVFVAKKHGLPEFSRMPGAGAAGGLGYAFGCFLGARLEPGFALFAQYAKLIQRIEQSNLVITGEGAIDESSRMGKGVGEIARLCHARGVPCIGLAGSSPWQHAPAQSAFAAVWRIVPELTHFEASRKNAAHWLATLAEHAAGLMANNPQGPGALAGKKLDRSLRNGNR